MTRIYCLIDPRDHRPRYVGKTDRSLAQRLSVHYCCARKGSQLYSARWLRQLLALGLEPTVVLLEETENGAERERHWIKQFREAGSALTNVTDGGEGTAGLKGKPMSPERKELNRQCQLGKPKSEAAKAKMRKSKTAAARANMSLAQKGHKGAPMTPEYRAKLSAALKGKPKSPAHVAAVTAALVRAKDDGRWKPMYGTTSPNAKITEADVKEMRRLRQKGALLRVLAERYGIDLSMVARIVLRKAWKHVP